MRITKLHKLTFLVLGLASLGLFLLGPKPALASNPATINFQGKVVNNDGTNVANGTYSFIFRIYNTSSPVTTTSCTSTASCLWEETQSSVIVTNGVFQVELGSACALTSGSCNNSTGGPINWSSTSSLYLTMKFNGDSAGFMSPTIHIASVPFALQADNSSTLGGLSSGNFVQLAQGVQNDTSTSNPSIFVNKNNSSGTPNILELQKSSADVLVLTNGGLLTLQPAAGLTSGQTADSLTFTNGSSSGGTINGYNQTITVNNTSPASSTNGINIGLTDSTTGSLANVNQGVTISLGGTNSSQKQTGANVSVNHGIALLASSSGTSGSGITCGSTTFTSLAVCAAQSGTTTTGTGLYAETQSGGSSIGAGAGTAIYGINTTTSLSSNTFYTGVVGVAGKNVGSTSATTIGVYGATTSANIATAYGGYFIYGGGSGSGAALYASNSTLSASILELQNNTTDVLVVGNGGAVTLTPTGNNIGTVVRQTSGTATSGNVFDVQGANGTSHFIQVAETAANAGSVSISSLGSNALTLDSGNGTLVLGANTTTIQKSATSLTLDVTNSSDSTLTVTNSGAGVASLSVEGDIAVGSGQVFQVGSTSGVSQSACSAGQFSSGWAATGGLVTTSGTCSGLILNQSSLQSSSQFHISAAGQSDTQFDAPAFDAQSAAGVLGLGSTNAGAITLGNAANSSLDINVASSATAIQLKNQNGTVLATVATNNATGNNLVTDPSFEAGSLNANWTALNAGTPTQDTAQFYEGTKSMKVVTGTNASGGGAKYTTGTSFLVNGTTYTLSAYVKTDYAGAFTTFEMGHADNGTLPTLVPCLTGKNLVNGWTKLSCTWISGAITGSPFIYFKQTDATSKNIWVDDIILQTDANTTSSYRNATLDLTGTEVSSALILHDTSNETNALQVQNATGVQVFNVDTTDTNLAAANPGFEVNAADWALKGSATALQRDTSKSYQGIASGKFITTSTSGDGARFTFPAQLPSSTYTISVEVLVSAADSTFNIGYNNGSDTNCASISPAASATAPSTTGWIRFTCTTATSAVLNSVYITSGTTAESSGMWVDGLEVDAGSTANNYAAGQISFNGTLGSPVIFQASSNSTTAFQIQNSSGVNQLAVDTLNNLVIIGTSTKLQFLNSTNANTISIASGATAGSITVDLPATTPGASTQQGATSLPFVISLTADSAALNSTTLGDITASGNVNDALSLVIPAGATVKFNAQILYVSSSTSNSASIGWKCSNTAQLSYAAGIMTNANSATAASIIQGSTSTACGTTAAAIVTGPTTGLTTAALAQITGVVKANAASATTLTFEYARTGNGSTTTTIKAGSSITWWQ